MLFYIISENDKRLVLSVNRNNVEACSYTHEKAKKVLRTTFPSIEQFNHAVNNKAGYRIAYTNKGYNKVLIVDDETANEYESLDKQIKSLQEQKEELMRERAYSFDRLNEVKWKEIKDRLMIEKMMIE
ncbi:MAG: hypothetical protein ACYCS1_05395 [Gammaproteobacteria bacterium]